MICIPCRKQHHDQCDDNERLAAAAEGKLTGISDSSASSWCYCHHVVSDEKAQRVWDHVDC